MEKDTTEIEKLTERIAKDPKSKLFVPLAEEYKKAGDIEMAVQVLVDGLRSNPAYVTARSFLGRLLLEKGDLAGAQKELEEVIKAIPDNLLAQRKLGDIYVLQGKGRDALPRYKAALALNPGDKELPSLLADLEAGRDIASRIPGPKSAPAAATAGTPTATKPKTGPAAAKPPLSAPVAPAAAQKAIPAAQKTEPLTVAPSMPAPAAATAPKSTAAPSAPLPPKKEAAPVAPATLKPEEKPMAPAAAAPVRPDQPVTLPAAAQSPPDEVEVVEEIVEIEHLEKPVEVEPTPPAAVPAAPAPPAVEPPAFDLSDISAAAPAGTGDIADVSWGSDTFSVPPLPAAVEASVVPEESSDDLNTNTLAELYISQGFYDKALEVYQGMLGERPDNKVLLEKIEKLRALTDAAAKGAGGFATPVAESGAFVPPSADAGMEPVATVETREAVPTETPAPVAVPASPSPEVAPMAEAVLEKAVVAAETEKPAGHTPRAASTRRKETIDRLESWLSNIMKEKKS